MDFSQNPYLSNIYGQGEIYGSPIPSFPDSQAMGPVRGATIPMVDASPFSSQPQQSQGLGSKIIGKSYDEMTDMERFAYDAEQVQAEEALRRNDPNYRSGFTDYELSKEAQLQKPTFKPGISAAEPAPGTMGPVDLTNDFTYDDPLKNMPGSTSRLHYNDKGEYIPGMTQRRKEKEARKMAASSCPTGMEYDPDTQRCVPEGTLKKARQDKRAASQPKREAWVNAGLAIGNRLLGEYEDRKEKERMKQLENIIQANRFTAAPMDRGYGTVNLNANIPTTPTQFTGYNPNPLVTAKMGKQIKDDYVYLTPQQIMNVISMGGQVEFLD